MKIIGNIIKVLFFVILFLSLGFFIFFNLYGEKIVKEKLTQAFKRPITLENLRVTLPFGLACDQLDIEGIIQAKGASIYFGFPDLLGKKINIANISLLEPRLKIVKTKEKKIVFDEVPAPQVSSLPEATQLDIGQGQKVEQKDLVLEFKVDHMSVKNGSVDFTDKSGDTDFQMTIQDIEFNAWQVTYPLKPVNANFDLTASILKSELPFSGSQVEARGWVNWPLRNMDGNLTVKEPNGKVSLEADLKSEANDMTVQGRLQVQNLIKENTQDGNADSFENLVFSALKSTGVAISANFKFQTKMDDFQLGAVSFAGNVGYKAPGETSQGANPQELDIKSIGKQFEDFGKKFMKENMEKVPEAPAGNAQEK